MTRVNSNATNADTLSRTPSHVVKARLARAGFTLQRFADRIGRSHSLISLVIHKKTKSRRVWREIARVLNDGRKR